MISLEHVSQAFDGRAVLRDLTYQFLPRTTYVLQGPSGSGKSTVLNLIAGYLAPDSGRVATAGPVEYLMQEELLFSELTVLANLQIRVGSQGRSAEEARGAIAGALARLGLGGREREQVATLSGGERRRVELAGTLLRDPAVLLLDEPTANLDGASAREVYAAIAEIATDRTVIVVTHEQSPTVGPDVVHLALRDSSLEEI